MSDVRCDCCSIFGLRKRGRIAPKGWSYIAGVLDGDREDPNPEDVVYVYACSERCKDDIWKEGPGKLITSQKDKDFVAGL